MSELNNKIIELVHRNYSVNDLIKELGLTNKQLAYRLFLLERDGFCFNKKYFSNGEILLSTKTVDDINCNYSNNDVNIVTKSNCDNLHIMAISDTHFGCFEQNLEALYTIYDYCKKHKINIITHSGDVLHGSLKGNHNKFSLDGQLKYLIDNYPCDENILNFIIFGNHDITFVKDLGLDLKSAIASKRIDIVPLGYGYGFINIKNDKIGLFHELKDFNEFDNNFGISLIGHSHLASVKSSSNIINVPSLSNFCFNSSDKFPFPQAMDIKIKFSDDKIVSIHLEHLLIMKDNIYCLSKNSFSSLHHNCDSEALQVNEFPKSKVRKI